MTLTAQAEALDDTATALAEHAGEVNAAAWDTGLDPSSVRGITGAALALRAPRAALTGSAAPYDSDRELLTAVDELAAHVARLAIASENARRAALDELEAAQ